MINYSKHMGESKGNAYGIVHRLDTGKYYENLYLKWPLFKINQAQYLVARDEASNSTLYIIKFNFQKAKTRMQPALSPKSQLSILFS